MSGKDAGATTAPVQQGQTTPAGKKPSGGEATVPAGGRKGPAQMPGGCLSWGCKTEADRFNFCPEHYEHFKFGLIKKTGEPVPDYEKKIEHYAAYRAKAKKAA